MMKKQKGIWLKYGFYVTGIIGFVVFILVRFDKIPEALIVDGIENHGELYFSSYIDLFAAEIENKIHYRERLYHPDRDINKADILTFGDSFFEFPLEKPFSLRLADTLNKEVYHVNNYYVLEYLDTSRYVKGQQKVLLLDIVERYFPLLFATGHTVFLDQNRKRKNDIFSKVFLEDAEKKYTLFLQQSIFTHDIYTRVNTMKYNILGYTPSVIPKFSTDPVIGFHVETVNDHVTSAYYHWEDAEIEGMCDNILVLKDSLKEKYNLELLIMPMPNPYTIYRHLIDDPRYNDLLPRLYKGMRKRNIRHVELMGPFLEADGMVYYGTDTHWNKKGQDIALGLVMKELEAFEKEEKDN